MENKKNNKAKTTQKETKKVVKKTTVKKVASKKPATKKKTKKGFTLIELLAVIIILGVLMIIAIPAVTSYISNSRKSSYISSAKNIISGARTLVNQGNLGMYDTNTTYYIPASFIKSENGTRSPYGDFTQAYIGVIYTGKGYNYFWISNDTARQGIKNVTAMDKLDNELIESNLNDLDIRTTVETTGIEGRSKILILDTNGNWEEERTATSNVNKDGVVVQLVIYPTGKTKKTVEVGDKIIIGTEEFYVIKNDIANNKLTVLARYNINVGDKKKTDVTEGIQNKDVLGWMPGHETYGTVIFSNTNYWNGKVGSGKTYPGVYCANTTTANCAYVYDNNSNLYQYVNNYEKYIESLLGEEVSSRILKLEEAWELRQLGKTDILSETSYWLGTPYDYKPVWSIGYDGNFYTNWYNNGGTNFGIRPVIIF